ncbi:DJ-1/PfpI family protein [Fusobacterium sp. PH5-44]|uniref:DJ-1/PfpI family protein n=1 Tax=unclassified Fusobacterium TaxID=2648384 RepID=UPI003D1A7377
MKKILLLLLSGCESMEFSPFIDIFGWNEIVGDKNIQVNTCAFGDTINTSWDLLISPKINLSKEKIDINDYYAMVIPGGFGKYNYFHNLNNNILEDILINFQKHNKLIIGICTGAIILGHYKILNNKKATTYTMDNDRYFRQLINYNAIPVRENIVIDENIITSSNPASSVKVALYLLELLSSKENMEIVKKNMGL